MIDDLLKNKMRGGARHFADLPEVVFFDEFADHVENLEDAEITEFLTNGIVEMWLEFDFRGQHFSVGSKFGDYLFFVDDPHCPEEILLEVVDHFRKLLEK